jgi:hypothetical protein
MNWRSSSAPGGSPGQEDPLGLSADFNGDLVVSRRDLATLVQNFSRNGDATRLTGDADRDRAVGLTDLARLQSQWSNPNPSLPLAANASRVVVEPKLRGLLRGLRRMVARTAMNDHVIAEIDSFLRPPLVARRHRPATR